MKKTSPTVVSALCGLLIVLSFSGCGSASKGTKSNEGTPQAAQATPSDPVTAGKETADIAPSGESSLAGPKVQDDEDTVRTERGSMFSLPLRLLQISMENTPRESFALSPFSLQAALSMLVPGAGGSTKDAIMDVLEGRTTKPSDLTENEAITLKSANSLWIREGFPVRESFKDTLSDEFGAGVFVEDFSDGTAEKINSWCSDATNGLIPSIAGKITPEQMLFLINAVYFKASWQEPFNPHYERTFHSPEGDIDIPFMGDTRSYFHSVKDGWQLVEIPYKGSGYTFLLLLPPAGEELGQCISSLTPELVESLVGSTERRRISLSLPKFKIESSTPLNDHVRKMGGEKAFQSNADFSGICPRGGLSVSSILQKCLVDVDERGTEAAAVTEVVISLTSALGAPPLRIVADRPFVFMVEDYGGKNILFEGVVSTFK